MVSCSSVRGVVGGRGLVGLWLRTAKAAGDKETGAAAGGHVEHTLLPGENGVLGCGMGVGRVGVGGVGVGNASKGSRTGRDRSSSRNHSSRHEAL
jgi:hypothetical protein